MKVVNQESGKNWTVYQGDSCEIMKGIPSDTIHLSVTSIPFASLYTYSNSERDMGNCRSYEEFSEQYMFLGAEIFRVTMPGRLVCIHCMNLPTSKERDGYIGIKDFRGDTIRWMQKLGFIYHSEVCIWKDPVTAMQRTKALGLLNKQKNKDSSRSRQGIPDYLLAFRKPDVNPEPIVHTNVDFPIPKWQEYASPVWMDINPSKTLQKESARAEEDERHICPLQLEVIERAIDLWSNLGDVVLDFFDGIGSVGVTAIRMKRRHIGIELKESYFNQACLNLKNVELEREQPSFF